MEEKPTSPSLPAKAAKYVLGTHRGPLPSQEGNGVPLEEVETADTITLEKVQRTKTQNLRRHWARFWCCYTFFSIIFLAIFLPIFFLLIIPAIAQRVVDNSVLLLPEADILEPRPHSAKFTIKSALKLPIGVPVPIDDIALDLWNRDNDNGNGTWAILYIDGKKIDGNTTLGVTDQPTPLNEVEWQKYVSSVVFEKHARLSVRGTTTAHLGSLKAKVTMNKDIPQTTLNGFDGFSIADTQLLLPARSDGTNLVANATLPNPSVLTLEIGTTVLDLYSGDLLLGNATLDDLFLRPGNHSTPVRGILDLKVLINNLQEVLKSQPELKDGYLNLKTIGKSVHWKGELVPYYTNVMKNLTLTARVPVGGLIKNTLHGILNKNGTNILGNLNLTEPEGGTSALQDLIHNDKKRSAMIDVLEGLI
ncbi:hypothetical protein ASPWEDRAFT_38053 [Aspergillus wentii DTO 134E9]|uniref:Uncharacterized protein n=1 Tax=Aspergillus wentii DTO 134E9 TaxID=1073089 RepID=A0A1L9RNR6_ASPWE|nr:uncharacterized protein ASPWEDRAFT_38053 [Aspergillus wentii DTO 134E9]KAI9934378.1 hypothetical protein MW887_005455 [Aspergillus wentii]OJJ36477.1 hypothetical protein ASPWEDRAFT_38053 [Aspergillus wentii DTO 134E9]